MISTIGPPLGGNIVILTGTNLSTAYEVKVNEKPATFTVVDDTSLRVTMPNPGPILAPPPAPIGSPGPFIPIEVPASIEVYTSGGVVLFTDGYRYTE